MALKFVRVVLAVQEEDLPSLEEYLGCFIETEEKPSDFVDEQPADNPIQGAYVSGTYANRQEALEGGWHDAR